MKACASGLARRVRHGLAIIWCWLYGRCCRENVKKLLHGRWPETFVCCVCNASTERGCLRGCCRAEVCCMLDKQAQCMLSSSHALARLHQGGSLNFRSMLLARFVACCRCSDARAGKPLQHTRPFSRAATQTPSSMRGALICSMPDATQPRCLYALRCRMSCPSSTASLHPTTHCRP